MSMVDVAVYSLETKEYSGCSKADFSEGANNHHLRGMGYTTVIPSVVDVSTDAGLRLTKMRFNEEDNAWERVPDYRFVTVRSKKDGSIQVYTFGQDLDTDNHTIYPMPEGMQLPAKFNDEESECWWEPIEAKEDDHEGTGSEEAGTVEGGSESPAVDSPSGEGSAD